MIAIKQIISVWIVVGALAGCSVQGDETPAPVEQPEHIRLLNWVETADAQADADQAIAEKNYRLYVVAGRGEAMPGIAADRQPMLRKNCGIQYLPGSTDLMRSEYHHQLLKQAYDYAATYNQLVAQSCIESPNQ